VGDADWDLGGPALAGSPDKIAHVLGKFHAMGVGQVQVRLRSRSLDELIDQIEAFGAEVIPNWAEGGSVTAAPLLLEGKVAIVSGIGPAWAGTSRWPSLVKAPTWPWPAAPSPSSKRVAAEVEALGVRALPVVCDIADEASCTAAAATVGAELGQLDVW
jgi:hypothetical protein